MSSGSAAVGTQTVATDSFTLDTALLMSIDPALITDMGVTSDAAPSITVEQSSTSATASKTDSAQEAATSLAQAGLKSTPIVIGIVAGVIVVIAVSIGWFFLRRQARLAKKKKTKADNLNMEKDSSSSGTARQSPTVAGSNNNSSNDLNDKYRYQQAASGSSSSLDSLTSGTAQVQVVPTYYSNQSLSHPISPAFNPLSNPHNYRTPNTSQSGSIQIPKPSSGNYHGSSQDSSRILDNRTFDQSGLQSRYNNGNYSDPFIQTQQSSESRAEPSIRLVGNAV